MLVFDSWFVGRSGRQSPTSLGSRRLVGESVSLGSFTRAVSSVCDGVPAWCLTLVRVCEFIGSPALRANVIWFLSAWHQPVACLRRGAAFRCPARRCASLRIIDVHSQRRNEHASWLQNVLDRYALQVFGFCAFVSPHVVSRRLAAIAAATAWRRWRQPGFAIRGIGVELGPCHYSCGRTGSPRAENRLARESLRRTGQPLRTGRQAHPS